MNPILPIRFAINHPPSNRSLSPLCQWTVTTTSNYLSLWPKQERVVIEIKAGSMITQLHPITPPSWITIALKIVSYLSIILPLIAATLYGLLCPRFEIDPLQSSQIQLTPTLTQATSSAPTFLPDPPNNPPMPTKTTPNIPQTPKPQERTAVTFLPQQATSVKEPSAPRQANISYAIMLGRNAGRVQLSQNSAAEANLWLYEEGHSSPIATLQVALNLPQQKLVLSDLTLPPRRYPHEPLVSEIAQLRAARVLFCAAVKSAQQRIQEAQRSNPLSPHDDNRSAYPTLEISSHTLLALLTQPGSWRMLKPAGQQLTEGAALGEPYVVPFNECYHIDEDPKKWHEPQPLQLSTLHLQHAANALGIYLYKHHIS